MQELSMNILDIAENSVAAGARRVELSLCEDTAQNTLAFTIRDDGRGMDEEMVKSVTDPFVTTRTTRKVGLGLPFLKMAAEQTGGSLHIESEPGRGTTVSASFTLGHIDLMPLGNLGETMAALVASSPEIDFLFSYQKDAQSFAFDTREARELLGDVSLSEPAVAVFIKEYINEHMGAISAGETPAP